MNGVKLNHIGPEPNHRPPHPTPPEPPARAAHPAGGETRGVDGVADGGGGRDPVRRQARAVRWAMVTLVLAAEAELWCPAVGETRLVREATGAPERRTRDAASSKSDRSSEGVSR